MSVKQDTITDTIDITANLRSLYEELVGELKPEVRKIIEEWDTTTNNYRNEEFTYMVRNKEIKVANFIESLKNP